MFGPTNYLPGSPEKVELLQARYEAGLGLWHPEDRKDNGDVNHAGSGSHLDGLDATKGFHKQRYSLHICPTLQRG